MDRPGWLKALRRAAGALRRRFSPVEVPEAPLMPPAEAAELAARLRGVGVFLEYGAGGSTRLAGTLVRKIVSVDSDARYLRAVAERLPRSVEFRPVHVDIGLTEEYGIPAFKDPAPSRLEAWKRYPSAPWDRAALRDEAPGLVLIDGRFRVACVLECMLRLPLEADPVFLLDDYGDRPHYAAIVPFVRDLVLVGRMAVFRRSGQCDLAACARARDLHLADWR